MLSKVRDFSLLNARVENFYCITLLSQPTACAWPYQSIQTRQSSTFGATKCYTIYFKFMLGMSYRLACQIVLAWIVTTNKVPKPFRKSVNAVSTAPSIREVYDTKINKRAWKQETWKFGRISGNPTELMYLRSIS